MPERRNFVAGRFGTDFAAEGTKIPAMTIDRQETNPIPPRRPFTLRSAFELMAGISIAAVSVYLLSRRDTRRMARAGLEALPLLLPVILGHRRDRKPAAIATPPKPRLLRRIGAYALPILLCLALGGAAGWLQRDALTEWYPYLLKPAGTPPDWLFPVVWGVIYVLMGISAGRILTAFSGPRRDALTIWSIQLGVNFLWSILFFVCRSPLWGMIAIVTLDALVALYIDRSRRVRSDAAWLFVPYLVWILYATYLNSWILAMNGPGI